MKLSGIHNQKRLKEAINAERLSQPKDHKFPSFQIKSNPVSPRNNYSTASAFFNAKRGNLKELSPDRPSLGSYENTLLSGRVSPTLSPLTISPRQNQFSVQMRQYRDELPQKKPAPQPSMIETESVSKAMLKIHYVIGKGGFGKVWKVEMKKTKTFYAMKEMSKAKVLSKKSVHSVVNERLLLSQLRHPFLANMYYAFQDRTTLYLVMDFLTGGDLRYHIGRIRKFSEYQTKFFCACIVLALEYLHTSNVIHRDIKPENLVIDRRGYVRVTDLGVARILRPDNSQDTSGTPGYMAPEVMFRQSHGFTVDYYALGVIAFELMLARRPYVGRNRKEIRDSIVAKQVQVKKTEIPQGWSLESADFVNRMIQRKSSQRLGSNGIEEIKMHPWFLNFPWVKLMRKELTSPFIPQSIDDNLDYQRQISTDHDSQDEQIKEQTLELRRPSIQAQFQSYDYSVTQSGPILGAR